MSKNRIKLPATPLTRVDAEGLMEQLRFLTLKRNERQLELEQYRKELDAKFSPEIADLDAELERLTKLLRGWALSNEPLFNGKRSLEFTHGKLGYRLGTPKLGKLVKLKWAEMVGRVREALGSKYIRITEEVDKELIIANSRNELLTAKQLAAAGVSVEQEETFFVEPKIEQPENRQVAAA